ncbi:MAG: DNA-binding response OmpR family regulator [Phenylobacterium sp.]|jgi:DNA-binding response OmpR family regulator
MKILVVDPMAASRTLTCRHLNSAGYSDVIPVEDGPGALTQLQNESFNLAIIDWHTPGLELVKQIRGHDSLAQLPLLMAVKEPDLSHVREALEQGANGFIMQPASVVLLAEKISSMVSQ